MPLGPFHAHAGDLAPGDCAVADGDWSALSVERVRSTAHPSFEQAYQRLWSEFGHEGAMERREVIADRLRWDPRQPPDVQRAPASARGTAADDALSYALSYEMLVVRRGRELVAVRDHTAIVPLGGAERTQAAEVVVHLSHVLVEPSMRGSGLAAWMRALPLQAARECAAAAGRSRLGAVTLVAEMEHMQRGDAAVEARLRSYARAGFRVPDPARVPYHQPDFRSPQQIERTGVRLLPFVLVMRRVGREHETTLAGAELRRTVTALYAMFAVHARPEHMQPVRALLDAFPAADDEVSLLSPLQATAVGEGT